jgi:hypothetical protein
MLAQILLSRSSSMTLMDFCCGCKECEAMVGLAHILLEKYGSHFTRRRCTHCPWYHADTNILLLSATDQIMWDESPSRCDPSFRTHSSECLSWYCRDSKVYVWALQHDDQKVKDYGVTLAVDMIRRITTEGGIRGVHFCTLNLEKSVRRVLENLEWIPSPSSVPQNKLIAVR